MVTSSSTIQRKEAPEVDAAIIRFAGDSGDGMQLVGTQFTHTTALAGNDLATLPDFPAEIRAPAGTLPGVSAFQIQFGDQNVCTPGDAPNMLVAMNPAALKVHLKDLADGGIVLANSNAFTANNLKKAGYDSNPLTDGSLDGYRLLSIPLADLTLNALAELELKKNVAERCTNFFALGITYWIFDRSLDTTLDFIHAKFKKNEAVMKANEKALKTGYYYAETTEMVASQFIRVKKAEYTPGLYRNIAGNQAMALGFLAASQLASLPIFYGSYPITPASDVLHELARHKNFGVRTFQAEDEIAAVASTIGAAFVGSIAITGTSGPGICLKSEAINLAIMTELPLIILNVQRGGPSTGLPTKTEQSDLLQALYGRNGESPLIVIAPNSPGDCFFTALEACRLSLEHMTPVIILSDGYLGNGAEPWKIPDTSKFEPIKPPFRKDPEGFKPYSRDKNNVRPWAIPGTPDLEHRLGGLEKANITGNVSYDPDNHDLMCRLRADKVARIADRLPKQEIYGDEKGDVLVLAWGGTFGAARRATQQLRESGHAVSHVHLRHLNPMPKELGDIIKRFKKVFIPELNLGQLNLLIRAKFLVDTYSHTKVAGQPFKVSELRNEIMHVLETLK